jgi:hypothetical protein
MLIPPVRWLVRKTILPAPGKDRPPQWLLDNGWLHVVGQGEGVDGTKVQATIKVRKEETKEGRKDGGDIENVLVCFA